MQLEAYSKKSIDTTQLKSLLTQNESNIDKPIIVLPLMYEGVDLKPLTYSVRAVNSKGDRIEQTLTKTITLDAIKLEWIITDAFTTASGQIDIELVGVSSTRQELIIFNCGSLQVRSSLTGKYSPPATVLEAALSEMHIGVESARTQLTNATAQANNSKTQADKAETSATAAKLSETNSKTSETTSSQALKDLLAILGTDIPTLVGGKIPLAQIPATATQEIYTITAESELISLVAQKGDLAQLIETIGGKQTITKAWQLLTNDPTVPANWVIWGTSYAVQAGYADTVANADNASMINNHRMIEMTQAEFDTAVKDSNTYYLVY